MARLLLLVLALGLACAGPEVAPLPTDAPTTDAPTAPAPAERRGRGRKKGPAPVAGVLPSVASSTGTPGAGTLVTSIYGLYAKADQTPPGLVELGCFTRSLQALIVAADRPDEQGQPADGKPWLSYDPVLDGDQDWTVTQLHVSTTGKGSSSVTVIATFDNLGAKRSVTYDVVDEDGAWRVDDIRSAKNDLRKAITP